MSVWNKDVIQRKVTDVWQAKHFDSRPNPMQDQFEFWHTVEASLEYRGNAFIWKTLGTRGQVIARTALHPGQVQVNRMRTRELLFDVTFQQGYPLPPDVDGYGQVTVGPEVMLHIKGRGGSGELLAPTPIQRFRRSLGLSVSKQEHEASLLANGAGHGLVAIFPPNTKQEEADAWRARFDGRHAGPENNGRTKVIGGGVDIKQVSMTQADAQFVESVELSLRDVCFIYHIPPWLLDVGPGNKAGSKPATPEHEMQKWLYYYLGPRLSRIESAFNADVDYFEGTSLRCLFDTSDVVRGDLKTEDMIDHQRIQSGRLLVDEWRIEHGREPLPGGVGMIPQIIPVGGAPNPVTPGVQEDDD